MNSWQEHLKEYYDPNIHKNMTFNKFLLDYKRHLKKTNLTHFAWVEKNEGEVTRFIKANFSKTLHPLGNKISPFWNKQ
jgi:hypothetical protein